MGRSKHLVLLKHAMELILQLVNETTLPDGGPVNCHISGKRGIDIGRAAHLDWTLPDPTRYISSKHCEIRYNDGGYWLHDVSTNGTFLNGADNRMRAPHRLRNGDRFTVGHYIVAVTVNGAEEEADERPREAIPPPIQALNDQELWLGDGEVPPPIDPRHLRPGRHNAPVQPDFLDWAADVPDPFHKRAPDLHLSPSTRPVPAPMPSDIDWAEGPPSAVRRPPPSSVPTPAPGRPEWGAKQVGSRQETTPVIAPIPEPSTSAGAIAESVYKSSPLTVESESSAGFVREIARSAGLPADLLLQKDPDALAQQIGTALKLLTENLMQLLNARQQTKRLARSSSHTIIQATDNNPLKFSPSADDALRIMFGPQTAGYLSAHRAIAQGFDDLKVHQIRTYSAMQNALTMIMAGLDPETIKRETEGSAGLGRLLQPPKAKLWDAYTTRWEAKVGSKGGEVIEAFMQYFAEYYDRDGG
jgi:type VI secretion system protein ImpI